MSERGVSEVLGFVLVFSLITLSVGTVYVVGIGGLQDARDAEQLENVERAFDVLDDNIDDIVEKGAPNRATEIRLYESDITVGEPTRFTVTITNIAGDPSDSVATFPIVYQAQGTPTTIRYIGGATIREDRNGAVILNEPLFVFRESASGERTAVLPLVETRATGSQTIGGTGTVLVRTNGVISETLTARTTPNADTGASRYDVQFTVQTTETRAALWQAYLNDELTTSYSLGSDPCSPTGTPGEIRCDFSVERLYVTATRIDVNIDN